MHLYYLLPALFFATGHAAPRYHHNPARAPVLGQDVSCPDGGCDTIFNFDTPVTIPSTYTVSEAPSDYLDGDRVTESSTGTPHNDNSQADDDDVGTPRAQYLDYGGWKICFNGKNSRCESATVQSDGRLCTDQPDAVTKKIYCMNNAENPTE